MTVWGAVIHLSRCQYSAANNTRSGCREMSPHSLRWWMAIAREQMRST